MDLRLPDLDGVARRRRSSGGSFRRARIIALTSYDGDHDISRALDAGVRGYLLKEAAHARAAPSDPDRPRWTHPAPGPRRRTAGRALPGRVTHCTRNAVLRLVAEGLGNREIGHTLGTASGTVKMHIQNILHRLGAADRTHAVKIAVQRGVFEDQLKINSQLTSRTSRRPRLPVRRRSAGETARPRAAEALRSGVRSSQFAVGSCSSYAVRRWLDEPGGGEESGRSAIAARLAIGTALGRPQR